MNPEVLTVDLLVASLLPISSFHLFLIECEDLFFFFSFLVNWAQVTWCRISIYEVQLILRLTGFDVDRFNIVNPHYIMIV